MIAQTRAGETTKPPKRSSKNALFEYVAKRSLEERAPGCLVHCPRFDYCRC
jgi:hypothetical protein